MKRLIIAFISILLLNSCGFHLRGFEQLQVQNKTIYVYSKNENSSFTHKLINHLHLSNAKIVSSPKKAQIQISILKEKINTRQTSIGQGQKTYVVTYEITYSVKSLTTKEESITIKNQRQIVTLPSEKLSNSNKLEETISDMEEELITQLKIK